MRGRTAPAARRSGRRNIARRSRRAPRGDVRRPRADRHPAPDHRRGPRPQGREGGISGTARRHIGARRCRRHHRIHEREAQTWLMANSSLLRSSAAAVALAAALGVSPASWAGAQVEEQLASSVVTLMSRAISDQPVPMRYLERPDLKTWHAEMTRRLAEKMPDVRAREEFLATVHYEATRAGLDPQLVLGVIQHES